MPFSAALTVVSEEERQELQQMAQSRSLPAGDVMRARMMLLLSEGVPYRKIQEVLNTAAPTISRWKERFRLHGVAGLMEERHPGQKPSVRTPKLQDRILAGIKNGLNDGSTHWSCRKLQPSGIPVRPLSTFWNNLLQPAKPGRKSMSSWIIYRLTKRPKSQPFSSETPT